MEKYPVLVLVDEEGAEMEFELIAERISRITSTGSLPLDVLLKKMRTCRETRRRRSSNIKSCMTRKKVLMT